MRVCMRGLGMLMVAGGATSRLRALSYMTAAADKTELLRAVLSKLGPLPVPPDTKVTLAQLQSLMGAHILGTSAARPLRTSKAA